MNTHIVLTLGDIISLIVFGLIVVGTLAWVAYCLFLGWKNNPKHWWNKNRK